MISNRIFHYLLKGHVSPFNAHPNVAGDPTGSDVKTEGNTLDYTLPEHYIVR